MEHSEKTEHILAQVGDFERVDFLRLAAACLDQADERLRPVPLRVLNVVNEMIQEEDEDNV